MLQVSDSDRLGRIGILPAADARASRMTGGFIASLVLHALVVFLVVFGWPWLTRAPPPAKQVLIIPVDVIMFGAKTAAPSSAQMAMLPQERAREVSKVDHTEAVPVEQEPPPEAAQHRAEDQAPPDPLTATKAEQTPQISKRLKEPTVAAQPATKLPRKQAPADALSTKLKQLAQLKQPPAPVPPNSRQQDGAGLSNVTATSADAARARDATYSVKDFIRAQVERRWHPDRKALAGNWTVAIHIVLDPDGTVSLAEIVNEARYRSDKVYMDFARSARNAVNLSSPLALPPGGYEIARDIVVDFDPRQVLQ